ncbi:hypothetical protein M2284_003629 [Rhodococcus sp. LBL1]|nr:hypothetical protein [Rhodococcus sp. LBL1]MDH6685454.1 hypothetical protein [Rhodococcus sp. LBL2]
MPRNHQWSNLKVLGDDPVTRWNMVENADGVA